MSPSVLHNESPFSGPGPPEKSNGSGTDAALPGANPRAFSPAFYHTLAIPKDEKQVFSPTVPLVILRFARPIHANAPPIPSSERLIPADPGHIPASEHLIRVFCPAGSHVCLAHLCAPDQHPFICGPRSILPMCPMRSYGLVSSRLRALREQRLLCACWSLDSTELAEVRSPALAGLQSARLVSRRVRLRLACCEPRRTADAVASLRNTADAVVAF